MEITAKMLKAASQRAATTKLRLKKTIEQGGSAREVAHLQELYQHQKYMYISLKHQKQLQDLA